MVVADGEPYDVAVGDNALGAVSLEIGVVEPIVYLTENTVLMVFSEQMISDSGTDSSTDME